VHHEGIGARLSTPTSEFNVIFANELSRLQIRKHGREHARVVWVEAVSSSISVQVTVPITVSAEISLGPGGAEMAAAEPGGSFCGEQDAGKLRELVMQPVVGPRTTGLQTFFTPRPAALRPA
jgi:hypothetical protein